jgi:hypothetical protein
MDSMIVLMAQKIPVSHIAELVEEHDTKIWRVLTSVIFLNIDNPSGKGKPAPVIDPTPNPYHNLQREVSS